MSHTPGPLIAAAPELLEACRAALEFLEQPVLDGGHTVPLRNRLAMIGGEYVAKRISDAITNASGKEPV